MTAPTPAPLKLTPLKTVAAKRGLPYSSVRDAAFRGEIRIFRSGSGERYARWYVDEREFDQYIESRMAKLA